MFNINNNKVYFISFFFIYDNLIYADWESTVELNKTKQNSEFKTRKKKQHSF